MRSSTVAALALSVIGEAARRQRGSRTQVEVAQVSGIPQSVLSRIENGEYPITTTTVIRLCVALGCRPSDLLEGLDEVVRVARQAADV
jgi:DNA-binding Xre family transcriptional regulator